MRFFYFCFVLLWALLSWDFILPGSLLCEYLLWGFSLRGYLFIAGCLLEESTVPKEILLEWKEADPGQFVPKQLDTEVVA